MLKIKTKQKGGFYLWKQTDTLAATSTTVHITAKTATAAALITLKWAATKLTPPNPNAPTADPLNTEDKFCRLFAALHNYF